MPCYNEGEVIEEVIRTYYSEIIANIADSEFIVIDDCSTDNTNKILEGLKKELPELRVLKTPVNSGHGRAMRMGYEAAGKEWVFQLDSDNQFDVRDFRKLYGEKERFDFILGFREKRRDPAHRLVLSSIIRVANFFIFKTWIKDANSPFRLIKRELLLKLLESVGKEAVAPNIMISVLAKKKGIKMTEVPVTHRERKTGVVSIAHWKLIKLARKGFRELLRMGKI